MNKTILSKTNVNDTKANNFLPTEIHRDTDNVSCSRKSTKFEERIPGLNIISVIYSKVTLGK